MHTRDNENTEVFTEICDSIIANLYPTDKKTNGIIVRKILLKKLSCVRKLYRRAQNFSENNSELSDAFLWLCDNFSFIEEEFLFTLENLNKQKTKSGKDALPLSYNLTLKFLNLNEGQLGESEIRALISSFDKAFDGGLDFPDRQSFALFAKSAVLSYIGSISQSIALKNAILESDNNEASLINAIKSLKKLSLLNFSECFSNTRLENILKKDPSGAYEKMDDASKFEMQHALHIEASRKKLSDTEYAKKLMSQAINKPENQNYIGYNLGKNCRLSFFFFPAVYITSFFVSLYFSIITTPILFPLLFFPVFEAIKPIAEAIFAKLKKDSGAVPGIKLDEIPYDAKTLCVITSLLRGEKYDAELFSKLERIYNANCGDHIKFGLLCDLSDSISATCADDEKIIEYACGRIDSLNSKYGNNFLIFIRPRSYSKSEGCFMAYERKRGAVLELTKLIKNKETSIDTSVLSVSLNKDFLSAVKFVITLDSDTNLGIDKAKDLVGKMLHPKNRPIIDYKKNEVVSGYGIMQPKMSTELSGARSTPFSRLMCDSGGIDIYSGASFELYQSLFGRGIFCGKGIFDVNAFYEIITKSEIFPEDKILSHDILEGEKLRTALLTDVELTDSFPKNELSYLKRKHRWIRGDIQNIRFLADKYRFSSLSKYKIFDNVRRVFTPVISLALIIISLFLKKEYSTVLFFCAFLPYIMPFITDVINIISNLALKSVARKFFSKGVTVGIWQSFLRMLYFEAMLGKDALMSLGASVISIYRMCISKRKLLEWVTAAQSDSGKTDAALFITKHIISSVLGALIFIFSSSGLIKLAGFAFFIMPLVAYFTSKNRKAKKSYNEKDILNLKAYANDIWRFFSDNVTKQENHLPPDNIQLAPYEKIAHRTSPTNIGLYLVSVLCARDMNLITTDEFFNRITATVETIEKLKKHEGHLFNWYDTKTLSVLNPSYISSVDSGNLVACLVTLKNGIFDYTGEKPALVETAKKINEIIEKTNFDFLYNKKRNLFYIGAEISDEVIYNDSCYDLFMSESRILSYYATSKRLVPKIHFKKLSRPLITSGGYIGLSSWSGTAFEYFMPALFMPFKKGSMLYEAMLFAYKAQIRKRFGKEQVWGISESGYFAFDCDLNYQYKAFGVPVLSRTNEGKKESVISPYSSFLSLCVSTKDVCKNLSQFEKMCMYGKYGFYEAIDFTKSRVKNSHAIVKSYMSHHLGMSLLAITNAIKDDSVIKRFMLDEKMACGKELLEEKIPVNAIIKKMRSQSTNSSNYKKEGFKDKIISEEFSYKSPVCACLSDGKTSIITSDCGHVAISKGDTLLNLSTFEKNIYDFPETLMCYLKLDGAIVGITPLSMLPEHESRFSFSYGENVSCHNLSCEKGLFSLSYTIEPKNLSAVRIKLCGNTKAKNAKVCFAFTPCMASRKDYEAHPAFSELFVESFFDKENEILFYRKRPRTQEQEDNFIAVAFSKKSSNIFFSTRRKYKMTQDIVYDPYILFEKAENETGDCINPFCAYGTDISEKCECELILVMAHDKESATKAILSARKSSFEAASNELSEISSQFTVGAGISSVGSCRTAQDMLSDIVFGGENKNISSLQKIFDEKSPEISINSIWKHGISGDHPIITVDVGNFFFALPLEKRIRAFRLLTMKNIRCDLVILYSETDRYNRKTEKKLLSMISSCSASGYLGRNKGGIHLIEKRALSDDIYALKLKSFSFIEIFTENPAKRKRIITQKTHLPIVSGKPCDIPKGSFSVTSGSFEKDFFCVDKTKSIKAPMSQIITGENISTVVNENSLGYTFCKNASERRITPWTKNGNSFYDGERLFLLTNGVLFDVIKCSSYVKYYENKAEYSGKSAFISYKITVFCAAKLPAKIIKAEINKDKDCDAKLIFCVKPCMGRFFERNIATIKEDNAILFANPISENFGNHKGFIKVFSDNKSFASLDLNSLLLNEKSEKKIGFSTSLCVGTELDESKTCSYFIIGAKKEGSSSDELINDIFKDSVKSLEDDANKLKDSLLPKINFKSAKQSCEAKSLEVMFNSFLPSSCIFTRMIARSGFYQSGGAFGFRDQLQDCLMLMYSDKKRALCHICRAASHQFIKGDVLHWWHTESKKGIRTTCSDDYLWLVYAICEYEKLSGDLSFLDIQTPYIEGEELSENENEKYIHFKNSSIKESLYHHAVRCLDRACFLLGEHGLSLMGCCDWCDGYSAVGKGGKGESTFSTMFLLINLLSFSKLCEKRGDTKRQNLYESFAEKLKESLIKYAFDNKNGYFIRGFYDDMSPLGSADCEEGKIDLMAQCFSPLCNLPSELSENAITTAFENLFDKTNGIMKLLTPAFDKSEKNPGYIKGYIPGVRENGGQYTHGALLFAYGCFVLSDSLFEKNIDSASRFSLYGGEILKYSNPAFRTSNSISDKIREAYFTEPYAMAADIYDSKDHKARGGWTHYTGAAGWLYRLILNYVFGIEIFDINTQNPYIYINTKRVFPLSNITDGGSLHINEFGFDLHLRYIKDSKNRVTCKGEIISDGKIYKGMKKVEVHI